LTPVNPPARALGIVIGSTAAAGGRDPDEEAMR
jgi:hypothetical protein